MIDVVVFAAVGILAGFCLVWLVRPDLRAWIEEPKYRFLKQVASYERTRGEK
jgi:hypothetical protein